jgi:DNA-binding LacI/PurR family transcriptional regulator
MFQEPAKWVQATAHLLMHSNQTERPDALLITDDNLIEPVTAGLVAAGVRVPDDLEIVAHCNFPWPAPTHLPITRVGYNVRRLLADCIASIDRQRLAGNRRCPAPPWNRVADLVFPDSGSDAPAPATHRPIDQLLHLRLY